MVKTQIPVFKEKNGVFYNFLKALKDYEYYLSATGHSKVYWEKWRAKEMGKYNLSEEELNEII